MQQCLRTVVFTERKLPLAWVGVLSKQGPQNLTSFSNLLVDYHNQFDSIFSAFILLWRSNVLYIVTKDLLHEADENIHL